MDRTRRLPAAFVEHAREFLASGREPVVPKAAATVVLLREGPSAVPEVYLLRRHLGMAFAGGMHAFPGGTVDPRDAERSPGWAGPSPRAWAERLRCPEPAARALVCAAVRETFEESGVLLAGADADSIVVDTTGEGWERDRAELVDKTLPFADFLQRRGLVLRSDLLAAWAHWVTPEFEPRRYDTHFFLAALPSGQRTRDVSGEADATEWLTPAAAIAGVETGEIAMLPPTFVTLRDVGGFASVDAALRAARDRQIETVTPGVEIAGDEGLLTLPADLLP